MVVQKQVRMPQAQNRASSASFSPIAEQAFGAISQRLTQFPRLRLMAEQLIGRRINDDEIKGKINALESDSAKEYIRSKAVFSEYVPVIVSLLFRDDSQQLIEQIQRIGSSDWLKAQGVEKVYPLSSRLTAIEVLELFSIMKSDNLEKYMLDVLAKTREIISNKEELADKFTQVAIHVITNGIVPIGNAYYEHVFAWGDESQCAKEDAENTLNEAIALYGEDLPYVVHPGFSEGQKGGIAYAVEDIDESHKIIKIPLVRTDYSQLHIDHFPSFAKAFESPRQANRFSLVHTLLHELMHHTRGSFKVIANKFLIAALSESVPGLQLVEGELYLDEKKVTALSGLLKKYEHGNLMKHLWNIVEDSVVETYPLFLVNDSKNLQGVSNRDYAKRRQLECLKVYGETKRGTFGLLAGKNLKSHNEAVLYACYLVGCEDTIEGKAKLLNALINGLKGKPSEVDVGPVPENKELAKFLELFAQEIIEYSLEEARSTNNRFILADKIYRWMKENLDASELDEYEKSGKAQDSDVNHIDPNDVELEKEEQEKEKDEKITVYDKGPESKGVKIFKLTQDRPVIHLPTSNEIADIIWNAYERRPHYYASTNPNGAIRVLPVELAKMEAGMPAKPYLHVFTPEEMEDLTVVIVSDVSGSTKGDVYEHILEGTHTLVHGIHNSRVSRVQCCSAFFNTSNDQYTNLYVVSEFGSVPVYGRNDEEFKELAFHANTDSDALLWAHSKMSERKGRKLVIYISDMQPAGQSPNFDISDTFVPGIGGPGRAVLKAIRQMRLDKIDVIPLYFGVKNDDVAGLITDKTARHIKQTSEMPEILKSEIEWVLI